MKPRKMDMTHVELDMTPMIDVVFQLLTFFMIAINFENTKADERIKLPLDILAKPPEVKPEPELVLNLGFNRRIDGTIIHRTPTIFYNERNIEVDHIGPDLESERRVIEKTHGKQALAETTVLIRADAEVPSGLVQELIKKCQMTGFTKYSLRATSVDR